MIVDSMWLLVLAPLLAAAGTALAWWGRRRRIDATAAWSPSLGAVAALRGGSGPWLVGIAVLCGAVAVAGPRGGRTSVKTEARALSLVIATDISRSMLAEDVQPSRLGRAKREARRLVQDLDGDRLGLIAFAGRSYILTPLTVDGGAVSLYLDGLDPDLASEGGTDLAATLSGTRTVAWRDFGNLRPRAVGVHGRGARTQRLRGGAAAASRRRGSG